MTVSKFSISASVTKQHLAALAATLAAERMMELFPVKEFSDRALMRQSLPATAEMAVLCCFAVNTQDLVEKSNLQLHSQCFKFLKSVSLWDLEICEKCELSGGSRLSYISSKFCFVSAKYLLTRYCTVRMSKVGQNSHKCSAIERSEVSIHYRILCYLALVLLSNTLGE